MTFMDILRKKDNLTVIDKLGENLSNEQNQKFSFLIRQAKKHTNLGLKLNAFSEGEIKKLREEDPFIYD